MSDFTVERMVMRCAPAEAEAKSYKIALDKEGCVWFYTLDVADPSGSVYFHDPNDDKSEGFGGRVITFKIGKCGVYQAKGPLHASASGLFAGTGVDLRDMHLIFGCVSLGRRYDQSRTVMTDVLYMDKEPMLGDFFRIENLAHEWADRLEKDVCYYSESGGGSSSGVVKPGTKKRAFSARGSSLAPEQESVVQA